MHDYYVNSLSIYFRSGFGIIPVFDVWLAQLLYMRVAYHEWPDQWHTVTSGIILRMKGLGRHRRIVWDPTRRRGILKESLISLTPTMLWANSADDN